MPYTIRKQGNQFCVHKQDANGNPTGDSLGCSDSHAGAQSQIQAMYANEQKRVDALRAAYETLTGEPVKPLKSANTDIMTPDNLEMSDAEKSIWERIYKRILGITSDEMKATLAAYGAVTRSRYSLAVKSAKKDGVVTVKGWGILYGDTGHKDLDQTYFSNKTKYLLRYFERGPLFIEHGAEDYVGSYPIGMRSLTEEYPDYGIWVEHELDPQEEVFQIAPGLHEQIVSDVDAGLYSYSSDSMSHHVSGGYNPKSGELKIWPLVALSLVKHPAEPQLGPVIR